MNFTYRIAGPDDRDNYIDFINYVFSHDHRPHDFKTLIPKEYRDGISGNAVHFLALNEKGQIRAVVAVLPFTMQAEARTLSCGYIGSVSVHPYARGEGHMKQLMAMANAWMQEQQMDLAVLAGRRQRYQYYGYTKGGVLLTYHVNADNIRHALKDVNTDAFRLHAVTSPEDPALPLMHDLQSRTPVHVVRDASQLYYILTGEYRELYAVYKDDTFAGYLTAGRDGSVSELLLADTADYTAVLRLWAAVSQCRDLQICVLPWERTVACILDTFAEDISISSCDSIRIFNWERTIPALLTLRRLASGSLPDGCCHICVDGSNMTISVKDGAIACSMEHPVGTPGDDGDASTNKEATRQTAIAGSALVSCDSLHLQERLFATATLLHPQPVNDEPEGWFPIPFAVPAPDHF